MSLAPKLETAEHYQQDPRGKAPAGLRRFLFLGAFREYVFDGDQAHSKNEEEELDDEVEGCGGAEIDEADGTGANRGEINGVVGDTLEFIWPIVFAVRRIHARHPFGYGKSCSLCPSDVVARDVTLTRKNGLKRSMTTAVIVIPTNPPRSQSY